MRSRARAFSTLKPNEMPDLEAAPDRRRKNRRRTGPEPERELPPRSWHSHFSTIPVPPITRRTRRRTMRKRKRNRKNPLALRRPGMKTRQSPPATAPVSERPEISRVAACRRPQGVPRPVRARAFRAGLPSSHPRRPTRPVKRGSRECRQPTSTERRYRPAGTVERRGEGTSLRQRLAPGSFSTLRLRTRRANWISESPPPTRNAPERRKSLPKAWQARPNETDAARDAELRRPRRDIQHWISATHRPASRPSSTYPRLRRQGIAPRRRKSHASTARELQILTSGTGARRRAGADRRGRNAPSLAASQERTDSPGAISTRNPRTGTPLRHPKKLRSSPTEQRDHPSRPTRLRGARASRRGRASRWL